MKPIIYVETLPAVGEMPFRYFASCSATMDGLTLNFSSARTGCASEAEALHDITQSDPDVFAGGYEVKHGPPPREEQNR